MSFVPRENWAERIGEIYWVLEEQMKVHTGISIHQGKTKHWNAAGCKPSLADTLTVAAQRRIPDAVVWRGDQDLPTSKQGLRVLGVPVGHDDYVRAQLEEIAQEHMKLLDRIPCVKDMQSAWLLLSFCAATRANFLLRTVRPNSQMSLPAAIMRT